MPEADDLALLIDAARIAGRIALRYWKRSPKQWEKGDEGPVTEADIAVNDALQKHLRAARPAYGWLSEETPDDPARLSTDSQFILDPIDGTRAFIAGEDSFSHAIAIAKGGQVTAGVVYLPALNRLFAATAQGPATLNGDPITASTIAGIEGATILTPAANMRPDLWPGGVPDLKRSFRASVAYRLALVAQGRFDGMLSFRQGWEWDIAAGALICQRAGATVTDARGEPLRFNRPHPQSDGLIAAAPALHAALLARL
ncbi:3'(2'),5'-bisphosphate nucleotidase CysQ [Paragemmobacter straminiformis]|uniref:3'(2'),5'-bisphosphate nucleotidase CysQ n=1 Tax=Paragemmobacter straminiformis TaxID=2045119 RepID=A0A842I8F9_9RHOB|nr:3'(2'),5'-bisphosphate nucleotidase CysQ [Gemmobacter straminiformis]MBC2836130.1 3'(2'),5'-bisphosphate nucleotidase CysQ [Gemmobacter straminiformis]